MKSLVRIRRQKSQRVIAAIMSLIMMFSLISTSVPSVAATNLYTDSITITIADENGNVISGASVEYSIDSQIRGEKIYSATKITDENGTIVLLSSSDYVENDLSVTAKVQKQGYQDAIINSQTLVSDTQDIAITMKASKIEGIIVTPLDGKYNGKDQELVQVSGQLESDKISYSVNGASYTSVVPKEKAVGIYNISVKVERDGCDTYETNVQAKIDKGSLDGIRITAYKGTYDGKEHDAITEITGILSSDKIAYTYSGETTDKMPKFKDAGTYTVEITIKREKYEDFNGKYTVDIDSATIKDGDISIKGINNLVYNGKEQELVSVTGITKADEVSYSVSKDGKDIDENEPKGKDAGKYSVKVTIKRRNYRDFVTTVEVLINKKDQEFELKMDKHNDVFDIVDFDSKNNSYQFKINKKDVSAAANIKYTVENASEGDNTDIDEIAEITNSGKLTVKKGGYNIAIVATVEDDDNYNTTSSKYYLTIQDLEAKLKEFEAETVHYTLGSNEKGIVSNQETSAKAEDDNGKILYEATIVGSNKTLEDIGLLLVGETVFEKNKNKLNEAIQKNGGSVTIQLNATKDKGNKTIKDLKATDIQKGIRTVYSADTEGVSYSIVIGTEKIPENSYIICNEKGEKLTTTNGWYNYQKGIYVYPTDGYLISLDNEKFYNSIELKDDGIQKNLNIYLKNNKGGITPAISLENVKIDREAPISLEIEYSEPNTKNGGYYYYSNKNNENVTITFKGKDTTSGIDYFTWSYNPENKNSASNKIQDMKVYTNVKAKAKLDQDGYYKAEITLPRNVADQLRGSIVFSATDIAGNTTTKLVEKDNDIVLVYDTIAPNVSLEYGPENKNATYQLLDKYYYSDSVKFTIRIEEANFYEDDVKLSVKRDGKKIDTPVVIWNTDKTNGNIHIGSFILSDEGDYIVALNYKDRSGNNIKDVSESSYKLNKSYETKTIVIDKTAPKIAFKYNDASDKQEASITITEHNFNSRDINLLVDAKTIAGEKASVTDLQKYLREECEWKQNGDKYTAKISSEFKDAIYIFTIKYKDLALNSAKELITDKFVVDRMAPDRSKMTISYSTPICQQILSNVTLGYYNPTVTVTFTGYDTTSGIDYFTWSYTRQKNASSTNVESYIDKEVKAIQDQKDKTKFTAKVKMPLSRAKQLKGKLAFTATDKCQNTSLKLTDSGNVIVVDTIAPTCKVEYSKANKIVRDVNYYNKDAVLTFKVKESNFDKNDVKIKITKNGKNVIYPTNWTDVDVDNHIGILVIPAAENHKNDGEYFVEVKYTDKSNNKMSTYTSREIIVDTIRPEINVSYSNNDPINICKDASGKNRKYYDEVQTATITIVEKNFNSSNVEYDIKAKDVAGYNLNVDQYIKKSSWKNNGDIHMMTISYPGDANYTFNIAYTDEAANKSDTYTTDYFTVDKTAPENLKVSYSKSVLDTILQNISCGFYQAKVRVTLTASDETSMVHGFKYSYRNAAGVSGVNAELVNQAIEEADISYSERGRVATVKFDIPRSVLSNSTQFNGSVDFIALDRANNESENHKETKRIIADNIAPTANVTYSTPVQTVDGVAYYDGNITATVNVNEANFYAEDVQVTVTKDGAGYPVRVSWNNVSTDSHVGAFSLTEDGDYFVSITYTDKSGNQMAAYKSEQLTIDTEINEPVIFVNGQEANGKAYKDEVVPSVKFEDVNLESYEVTLTRTRFEEKNVDVTDMFIRDNMVVDFKTGIGEGVFDEFKKEQDNDGIYILSVSMKDKSGHEIDKKATFTVNRFGSVYAYNDYLSNLIKDGGAYVTGIDQDLIVTEYNPDKLVQNSLHIEISRDGKPLETSAPLVTPEINNKVAVGNSGWYQYQYTISKDNFKFDGVYKILISSADSTGNMPQNTNYKDKEILFWVDSTAPEINSITGLEEKIINATGVNVRYTVYDAIGLKSVIVYVDGKEVNNVTDFGDDSNNYSGDFSLKENAAAQSVRFVVTDKAGNVTDTDASDFRSVYAFNNKVTVSTNIFVQWFANKILFIGSIVGILILLTALSAMIVFAKKKKQN